LGLITFTITYPGYIHTVTIDYRDRNWSFNDDVYPGHDLKIQIDQNAGELTYITSGPNSSVQNMPNGNYEVWTMWGTGHSPVTESFKYPVTLKNRVENENNDFGYLVSGSENISSGDYDLFSDGSVNSILHGTLEQYQNSERNYSFKWSKSLNVDSVGNPNLYNNSFQFEIDDEVATKEITRNFKTVYPLTIKNNLVENNGITAGEILFKDPTTTNQFETKSATGIGYVNNEAFEELAELINGVPDQKYSVKAKSTLTYDSRTYYWQDGDFNPTTQTDLFLTGATTKISTYKGTQLSNNYLAYSNSSQRKIVRTPNGTLHSVYESMGKVWYENSSDNGSNWIIGNNGMPLSNYEAKNPSIDYFSDNQLLIVFQEKKYSNSSIIKVVSFYGSDLKQRTINEIFDEVPYSVDANPSIYWGRLMEMFVVWKDDTNFKYAHSQVTPSTLETCTIHNGVVPNTNSNSSNPTITAIKDLNGSPIEFHLAWEQYNNYYNVEIRYYRLTLNSNNTISFNNYYVPSSNSGFVQNLKPSITVSNTGMVNLFWVGKSWSGSSGDRVALRSRYIYGYWGSSFSQYGSYVTMVNANTIDSHSMLGFVWYENSGSNTNKFRRTGMYYNGTLNTDGNYLQLSNGLSIDNMFAMSFNKTSVPYNFELSSSIGALSKSNTPNFIGRQGIVMNEGVEYYCTISDVHVDGEIIDFVEQDDEYKKDEINTFNSYLKTEPFKVSSESEFSFSVSYGLTDSVKALKLLGEKEHVTYNVELVDEKNNKIISVIDKIEFSKGNTSHYVSKKYKVDTSELTNKKVVLRLTMQSSLKVQTATASIEADSEILKKQNINITENISISEEVINEFALFQNYPNPFNPTTTISYQIPEDGSVTLKIYDTLGKEITTLVNGEKQRGKYNITFDASNLTSGIYFYSLTSGSFKETKKLILLK